MGNYDVAIEIDYYGDELTAVFYEDSGRIYTYPLDEVKELVDKLRAGGAEVVDKTVYSQNERMTLEEYEAEYGEIPDYLRY